MRVSGTRLAGDRPMIPTRPAMTPVQHDLPVDEHALAALLAGTLPETERQSLLARLATDPEARMVLQMAVEALEAVQGPGMSIAVTRRRPDGSRRAA